MSLEALTWAFKQDLKPTQKIVLLALADYADDENRCWPAMKTLAEKSSLSERAVRLAIRSLEEVGYLTTETRQRPNGSQTSNSYWLNVVGVGRQILPGGAAYPAGAPSPGTTPPEPSSNPQENTPPTPSDEYQWAYFDVFWEKWPNKRGKKDALKAWKRIPTKQLAEIVFDALSAHAEAHRRYTPPQYIPMLSTWLNGERWNDPLPVDRDRGARNPEPQQSKSFTVPPGHRILRDEMGHIIGTEPIE